MRRTRSEPKSANWVLIVFVILIVLSRFLGGGPPRGGCYRKFTISDALVVVSSLSALGGSSGFSM